MAESKGYKYGGPAGHLLLEEGGKVYHPGDTVPLTLKQAQALLANGHVFEELMPKAGEPQMSFAPANDAESWVNSVPTGDNGAPLSNYVPGKDMPVKDGSKEAQTTTPIVVPALVGTPLVPTEVATP